MKTTVILGDVHGYYAIRILEHWKDADHVVLLGDYLDSYDPIDPCEQIDNAKDIFKFVDEHPNMVTLIGNHDLHYLVKNEHSSRRFRGGYLDDARELMLDRYRKGGFSVIFKTSKCALSHAGITNTWLNTRKHFNEVGEISLNCLTYYDGDTTGYGANINQGPCWIRPEWMVPPTFKNMGWSFLEEDASDMGPYQVVGHTRCEKVFMKDNIIFCDCLATEHVLMEEEDDGDIRIYGVNSNTFEKRQIL